MNTFILKQMQTQGYLLRETIQKKTERKFGVHLVDARGLSIQPVSYVNLPKWLELEYIKFTRTKEIPGAKDLQHRFYTLGQSSCPVAFSSRLEYLWGVITSPPSCV